MPDTALSAAERKITEALRELETLTDSIVEQVDLVDRDATTIDDDRVQFLRHVVITLKRMPGTRWG